MDKISMREKIREAMELQLFLFNPAKSPSKQFDIQFIFNEENCVYEYCIGVKNKEPGLYEGKSPGPLYTISTNYVTWKQITGGYISGARAMKSGTFTITGNKFAFITGFRKLFSGKKEWPLLPGKILDPVPPEEIKKVVVISGSPRGTAGATHYFAEKLCLGMERAGAHVEVILASQLKINPCTGCFHCWSHDTRRCIFHDKDDMHMLLEKMQNCDLLVWATPIYLYGPTSLIKIIMDRLFISTDISFALNKLGKVVHPRKMPVPPYQFLLSCGGLSDTKISAPLVNTLKLMGEKMSGFNMLGAIYRGNCPGFLLLDYKTRKKDETLEALEQAGKELIGLKKVRSKTKKRAEQMIYSDAMLISAGTFFGEKIKKLKKMIYVRNKS